MSALHPSHKTRIALDASSYDEICVNCGATDTLGGWGKLAQPCPSARPEPSAPSPDPTPVDDDIPRVFEQVEHHKWPGDAPSPAGVEVVDDLPATLRKIVSAYDEDIASLAKQSIRDAADLIATLTASLDQATRRAEEAERREAAWEETRLANANLRNENGALRGRCSALEQALAECQSVLSNLINPPEVVSGATIVTGYATVVQAEHRAREALSSTASSITEKETQP